MGDGEQSPSSVFFDALEVVIGTAHCRLTKNIGEENGPECADAKSTKAS